MGVIRPSPHRTTFACTVKARTHGLKIVLIRSRRRLETRLWPQGGATYREDCCSRASNDLVGHIGWYNLTCLVLPSMVLETCFSRVFCTRKTFLLYMNALSLFRLVSNALQRISMPDVFLCSRSRTERGLYLDVVLKPPSLKIKKRKTTCCLDVICARKDL